jgi:hypothetical protein
MEYIPAFKSETLAALGAWFHLSLAGVSKQTVNCCFFIRIVSRNVMALAVLEIDEVFHVYILSFRSRQD